MTTAHRPTFDPVRILPSISSAHTDFYRPVAKKPSEVQPTINAFSQPTPNSNIVKPVKAAMLTNPRAISLPSFSLLKPPISPRRTAPLPSLTMPTRTTKPACPMARSERFQALKVRGKI